MQTGGSTQQSLLAGARAFLTWWLDELSGLVPEGLRRAFVPGRPKTVLAQVDDGFVIVNEGSKPGRAAKKGGAVVLSRPEALSRLVETARSNGEAGVGIRLPLDTCFTRSIELPAAGRSDLRRILDFDLERATPFKQRDVYSAHLVEGEAAIKGKLRVRQMVTKRIAVDPLVAEVRAAGLDVGFVDCWSDRPSAGMPVNFLEPREEADQGKGRFLRPAWVLFALALVLTLSAFMLTLSGYEGALARVRAQTAQARKQAAEVRSVVERSDAAVADLARLQDLKLKRIPAIEILEEVSRILPDTVWLNDLRMEGDTLDMSGLAGSAAGLPTLFERSAILSGASLAAPVTLDQREDKERFSLRARVKNETASRQVSTGEKQE